MKLLLVITKAEVGGAQMSVLNLAREMKRRGHEVTVAFGDGDFLPAELGKEGIAHIRFRWLKRTHNPLANLFYIQEIRKYARANHFEAVHFNSSNALFGAIGVKLARRKIRTVFTFRGMSMLDEHYRKSPLLKLIYFWLFKFLLLFVDAPVFVSGENLEKFGRGRLTAKGQLVYNGLDPEKMAFADRAEARRFLSEKAGADLNGKYIIGSIGRLDYAKNYEFLIENFNEVLKINPEAAAVIIGGGAERGRYEEMIKERGLAGKIFLLGSIDNGGRYLPGFDVFVQPSRYEGLSIALIESLFAGLPILTTAVGGNSETVGGLDEELYQLDDKEEFLRKLKALGQAAILEKAAENNRQQKDKFLLSRTADGYEKIYSAGAGEASGGGRRKKFWLGFLLIAVLALGSFLVFGRGDEPLERDSGQFLEITRNLLAHGRFAYDTGELTAVREPGYPLFLAAVFGVFGADNFAAAAWVQFFLFLVLIFCFYFAVSKIFQNKKAAFLASLLFAVFPSFNFYNGQILSESFFLFWLGLFATFFFYISRGVKEKKSSYIILALLISAAALVRTAALVIIPLFILYLLLQKKWRQALIFAGVCLLLLSPWMIRNHQQFKTFSLTAGRQELSLFSASEVVGGLKLSEYPKRSWLRIKKGFQLKMTEEESIFYDKWSESKIMWGNGNLTRFYEEHPGASLSDAGRYAKGVLLAHPFNTAVNGVFNSLEMLGPEIPTVVKNNKYFTAGAARKIFSAAYAFFYLAVYGILLLLFVKIVRAWKNNKDILLLYAMAAAVVAGYSLIIVYTRFNTPLFAIYFLLLGWYFNQYYFKDK